MAVIKLGGEWALQKPVALLGSASVMAALGLIVSRPPASEYEISIYEAYQPYLWLLIVLGLASGAYVLVGQALEETGSDLWLVGFALLQLTSGIVLLLPLLRGYVFYGAIDPMYHVGFVRDIQSMGRFEGPKTIGENVYPVSHILATS